MFSFSLKFLQELWSMLLRYDEEGGFPEAGNISLISLFSLGTVRNCILLILLLLYSRGRIKSKALTESFYEKKRHWNVKHVLYLIYCARLVWIFLSHCTWDTMQSSVFTKPSECHVANLVMCDWGLCLAIQDPLQQLCLWLKHSFNSWHYLSFMLFSSHIEIISKRWWRKLLHLVLI